jgi:DNA-binding CsgD family transcriptional regulator
VPAARLSLTEDRIVRLVAEGKSIAEAAAAVGIDERAVEWHLTLAVRKLERASALHRRERRGGP